MPTGGMQRLVTLPPIPDSARHARRFVRDVLTAADADRFVDTAELLTSELVTNGIVHAHTDLRIVVEATSSWVRVEVVDGDPHLPSRRDYDEQAMTGRGLEMVELLADELGMDSVDGDGKRVWFRLGARPGVRNEPEEPTSTQSRRFTLELPNLPVDLYCIWQQHADALLREALLASIDDGMSVVDGDFSLASQALAALAEAARDVFAWRDRDIANADASLAMAADCVPLFPILRDALGRATAMSTAGRLLVPPSLPELEALRRWLCDEVARQSAGLPPQSWTGIGVEDATAAAASPETIAEVRSSTAPLVAADSSNRIVAVSGAAAELLGWTPAALEGRRLVTIIPARLRDRHVAGFTRHLLDGSVTILGRSVRVPALRSDDSEIPVLLHIERRPDPLVRAVFVASLTLA